MKIMKRSMMMMRIVNKGGTLHAIYRHFVSAWWLRESGRQRERERFCLGKGDRRRGGKGEGGEIVVGY